MDHQMKSFGAKTLGACFLESQFCVCEILNHFENFHLQDSHIHVCVMTHIHMCHIFQKVMGLRPNFIGLFLMEKKVMLCIWFLNWMHGLVKIQGSVMLTHTRMCH